ncbi:hypothetical protein, partial [Methanocalculus sp.]|uniref:hypothetical protein n=1 Tax=Methanocalculus sp. TaxID=2004547 RepID=UPI002610DC14
KDVSLQELVSNISECDWRINSDGSEIDIMGQIWTKLFHDFEVGSNYDRTTILKIIEKIAYIQPSKSWELLQYALKNPNEENEEFFGIYCCSHESVLEIIPKVARNISYNVDYLPQCCDLLWHLGKNKTGILHSDPDHPIRILQNITEAGHYSPPIIQTKIIYAIERWLSESNIDDFIHSPLEILDPILQKEAEIVSYNGNVLRLSLFVIGYENTKKIRNKALSIISSLTQDRSIKVVLRAIKSLECALDPPRRLHERDIPDEEYKQWFPEEMMILNIFDELLKRTQNPIIQIQVNKVLKRFEKIGKNEKSRQKAALIRSNIDDSYQVRLARALQYSFDTDFNADYKSKMKELEEQTARVVAEFITNNVNEKEAYQSLCEQIVNFNEADIEYNPGRFFFYLGKEGSDYSIGLCRKILSEPSSPLINNFGPLLSGIKVVKPDIAKQLIREGIESKNQNICNSIAFNYSNGWWGAGNDEDELDFIERLLHSNNREIKKYAIESLKEFPSSLNLRIKEVALGLEITDDFSHADALCGTFFCRSQRMPIILGSDEMEIILEKLLLTRNLRVDTEGNGFYICSFLREVGKTDAGSLVDFLLKRINIALKSHENPWKGYEAIPSTGFSNFIEPVISCPSYQDILRKVRDATFSADKKTYFIRLFEVLSDNYSPNCLEVLEEWIHLRDPDKIFTISQLIQNAKSEFLFMNSDFINKIVEASFNTSPECHEKVLGKLFNIVTSEGRTGILGEPCPLDIQIRDQSMEYAEKYEEGSPTRKFYLELSRQAGHLIEKSLIIDDEAFE